MRDWHIGYRSSEIYGTRAGLYVYDVPWWAYGVSRLTEWVDTHIFRDHWCAPWEWTFKIGWDKDRDGYYNHSLGGFLYGSFNRLAGMDYRHHGKRLTVDLTDEWLEANNQTFDPFGDDDD